MCNSRHCIFDDSWLAWENDSLPDGVARDGSVWFGDDSHSDFAEIAHPLLPHSGKVHLLPERAAAHCRLLVASKLQLPRQTLAVRQPFDLFPAVALLFIWLVIGLGLGR